MNKKHKREEIARLERFDSRNAALAKYARNLNLEALEGKLGAVYNREGILDSVQKILLRRNKANVLLTGAAGCGKTAIAEALAHRIVGIRLAHIKETEPVYKRVYAETVSETGSYTYAESRAEAARKEVVAPLFSDCIIYELSMNALLGGSKYRGEFEQKLQAVLDVVAKNKNIILFIDETLASARYNGAKAVGAMEIGQTISRIAGCTA